MRKRDPCRLHDELRRRRKNESPERAIQASPEVPRKTNNLSIEGRLTLKHDTINYNFKAKEASHIICETLMTSCFPRVLMSDDELAMNQLKHLILVDFC